MATEKYNGHWILLPELSIYQHGESPVSGLYVIQSVEGTVYFQIEWTDTSGTDHNLEFSGPLDGQKHDSDSPGVSDLVYEKIDDSTLDSTAFNGDEILMYARRTASSDGSLLAVSQVFHGEDGNLSNFQVYRRKGT